jgi:predicted dehydrogenase
MNEALSIGVIGVGIHGTRYARHIQRDVPGFRLRGVYRRDEMGLEAAARELSIDAFDSAESLIRASDAVVIVTPPPAHAELIELALRHDTYALVEKPVTCTAEEAAPLVIRDRAVGGRVMVAHTLRYDGVISRVKARLADVGPIHHVRMAQRLSPSGLQWQQALETSGGGSILLTGVHLFDTVSWLLDEPVDITHCVKERVLNPATEDFFIAVGCSRSGVHVAMEVSKYTTHRACFIEVVGEHGQLLGDYHQPSLVLGVQDARTPIPVEPVHTVASVLRDFESWMRGAIENPIPFSDGVRAVALADRCNERAGG